MSDEIKATHPDNPIQTEEDYLKAAAAQVRQLVSQGEIVEVDPDVAEHMGAFDETTLGHERPMSDEDALDSHFGPHEGPDPEAEGGQDNGN